MNLPKEILAAIEIAALHRISRVRKHIKIQVFKSEFPWPQIVTINETNLL